MEGNAALRDKNMGSSSSDAECAPNSSLCLRGESSSIKSRFVYPTLLLILALGAAIRFYALDSVPPGLWFDEALEAQDAVAASHGNLKLVYPDEFPREPMMITLYAGAARVFGPRVVVFRAVSAGIGGVTVLALFFCVRSFKDDRTALLSSAFLASMRWHIIFSRLMFRTLLLPLWITLIVVATQKVRARLRNTAEGGCAKSFTTNLSSAILGVLVGGGFYTYLSWYFMLPGVVALLAWAFWNTRKSAVICALFALVIAAPILIQYAVQPDLLLARPAAVSPFKEGNGAGEIAKNFLQALGMFHFRGDHVPKQNIPHAPALNPVEGILFLVGIVLCIVRARRRRAFEVILLAWIVLGIAPTIFTHTDSPNFLRTLVVTPAVATIMAIGLERIIAAGTTRWVAPLVARGFVIGVIGICGIINVHQVFGVWAKSPDVWRSFNGDIAQLGKAAKQTPDRATFWIPAHIAEHRTFQFLSGRLPNIHPYANFDFLRNDSKTEGPRRVVATAHNGIYPDLKELVPQGKIIQEFKAPEGNTWALMYEIPAGGLPASPEVGRAEKLHPADVRW